MIRPTKIVATPAGNEVEIKTYLTARERNEMRNVFLKNTKINPMAVKGSEVDFDIDGSVLDESQNTLIRTVITRYTFTNDEGEKENASQPNVILEKLLDSTPEEYDFVLAEAGKVDGNLIAAK